MQDLISKQYDKKHKINRNYIHWDVSTICQLKCSYCYAMKDYKEDWGKIDSWSRQLMVIKNIERSSLPCFLGLLGGEPTIHPRYSELIELCHKAISIHKDGRLYVTTNGLQSSEFFTNHIYYKNMYFLWSIHFEYLNYKKIDNIIENIKICINKGFKNKVNVMLHPDKKHWDKIKYIINILNNLDVNIHPHFIYDDGDIHKIHPYDEEFYNEFKEFENYEKYFIFEDNNSLEMYNDYTLFKNKKTCFKNWSCYNNNFEINAFGKVNILCFNESSDLTRNINYFKNIIETKPRICPHDSCNCDGLLKIYKEYKHGNEIS